MTDARPSRSTFDAAPIIRAINFGARDEIQWRLERQGGDLLINDRRVLDSLAYFANRDRPPPTAHEVANRAQVREQTVNSSLARLGRRRPALVRAATATGRRGARRWELTPRGHEARERCKSVVEEVMRNLYGGLPEPDRTALREMVTTALAPTWGEQARDFDLFKALRITHQSIDVRIVVALEEAGIDLTGTDRRLLEHLVAADARGAPTLSTAQLAALTRTRAQTTLSALRHKLGRPQWQGRSLVVEVDPAAAPEPPGPKRRGKPACRWQVTPQGRWEWDRSERLAEAVIAEVYGTLSAEQRSAFERIARHALDQLDRLQVRPGRPERWDGRD